MEKISIFDILREEGVLKEADEDQAAAAEEQPAADTAAPDTNTDTQTDDTNNTDTDFNIDTSLDINDTGSDMGGGEDDDGSMDSGSSSSNGDTAEAGNDEELNPYNTNMFAALSAEEQKIKLIEQKKLYQTLYDSIVELLNRLNTFDTDESNMVIISRVSNTLFDLKGYVSDYILYDIPIKSYYDNEVMYNRFLAVINSIASVVDKYDKKLEKDDEK